MEEHNTYTIIFLSVLVVSLVCYIIALVKSKRGEMVFTANGWDMALLLICPIIGIIGSFLNDQPPYTTAHYVLWGISIACFIGTVIFSIVYNMDSIWKILCSIMAKVFTIWLTGFVFLLLIGIFIFILMRDRSPDYGDTIVLQYDNFLKAYVGYRV